MENTEENQDNKSKFNGFLPVIFVFGGLLLILVLIKVVLSLYSN
jgi:hypothetical protein